MPEAQTSKYLNSNDSHIAERRKCGLSDISVKSSCGILQLYKDISVHSIRGIYYYSVQEKLENVLNLT